MVRHRPRKKKKEREIHADATIRAIKVENSRGLFNGISVFLPFFSLFLGSVWDLAEYSKKNVVLAHLERDQSSPSRYIMENLSDDAE